MAYIQVADGAGAAKYLEVVGTGDTADPYRMVHSRPGDVGSNMLDGTTAAMTGTTTTDVIAAQATGVRIFVGTVIVANQHATQGTAVELYDGATLKATVFVDAKKTEAFTFSPPLRGTAATAFRAKNVTTGSSVIVSATGYKGA